MVPADNPMGWFVVLAGLLIWLGVMLFKHRNDSEPMSDEWLSRHIDNDGNYRA